MSKVPVSKIDVDEIIEEIRQEIVEKGYTYDELSFSDVSIFGTAANIVDSNNLDDNLLNLQALQNVQAYREIKSNSIFGLPVIFIKKLIRKFTRFYIDPIVIDQNEINRLTATCLADLYLRLESSEYRIRQLEAENKKLKNMQKEWSK